jgi:hypothetical protein
VVYYELEEVEEAAFLKEFYTLIWLAWLGMLKKFYSRQLRFNLQNSWAKVEMLHTDCYFTDNFYFVKITVFWVVAPCSTVKFTEVSEVLAASQHHCSDWYIHCYLHVIAELGLTDELGGPFYHGTHSPSRPEVPKLLHLATPSRFCFNLRPPGKNT